MALAYRQSSILAPLPRPHTLIPDGSQPSTLNQAGIPPLLLRHFDRVADAPDAELATSAA